MEIWRGYEESTVLGKGEQEMNTEQKWQLWEVAALLWPPTRDEEEGCKPTILVKPTPIVAKGEGHARAETVRLIDASPIAPDLVDLTGVEILACPFVG